MMIISQQMKFVFIMFLYKIISQISCSEYFDFKGNSTLKLQWNTIDLWC